MSSFSQSYSIGKFLLLITREYHFCESEDGLRHREEIIQFLKSLANKWLRETLKQDVYKMNGLSCRVFHQVFMKRLNVSLFLTDRMP